MLLVYVGTWWEFGGKLGMLINTCIW
jgi:hypothetical protein